MSVPESQKGPVVSTGRGGQGNIRHDPTVYTDGGIVREGVIGESEREEYSTGRGGAGNIGSPRLRPEADDQNTRRSMEVIPAVSIQPAQDESYHIGRGGGGNFHRGISSTRSPKSSPSPAPKGEPTHAHKDGENKESLGSRLKEKLGLRSHSPKPGEEK